MSRTTWAIYLRESGESWVSDGNLYAPNENFNTPITSTQVKDRSANGDNIFITPSTKYSEEQIEFVWLSDDGTIKDKIVSYIQNQTNLKIVDHNGTEYIGRFIYLERIWITGINPDSFDLRVIFEVMLL